jgi:hypothetical protein
VRARWTTISKWFIGWQPSCNKVLAPAALFEKIWEIGAERIVSKRQLRFLCRHKRDNRRASA